MSTEDQDEWDSNAEDEEDIAEPSEDDLLEDRHDRNLLSTRGIDQEDLADQTEAFYGTPFIELIKDVHVMRQLYGPSDPTINDLAEEIESGLRLILEQMRKNPMGLMFEIAQMNPDEIKKAQKILKDMSGHYEERGDE